MVDLAALGPIVFVFALAMWRPSWWDRRDL